MFLDSFWNETLRHSSRSSPSSSSAEQPGPTQRSAGPYFTERNRADKSFLLTRGDGKEITELSFKRK